MISSQENFRSCLVIQTAFIGDAILTLPMIQVLHKQYPNLAIDVVVVPRAAELFTNHPDIREIFPYDKRSFGGVLGYFRLRKRLRSREYDLAIVPHRSVRSAMIAKGAKIPVRIGFDLSSAPKRFTETVRYRENIHESERNISLLKPLQIEVKETIYPDLYPSRQDHKAVENFLLANGFRNSQQLIGIAPGTVWNTKRWLKERFAQLAQELSKAGNFVVLIGGNDDVNLCKEIEDLAAHPSVINAAGKLSLLKSAALIQRCSVLVSNDSAPMHIAVAMKTQVVGIFGATVPSFGFAPYGQHDVVVETIGLTCRPCTRHGGKQCPIKTFECMDRIRVEEVFQIVMRLIGHSNVSARTTR
jgi:heptosyltransferase-2